MSTNSMSGAGWKMFSVSISMVLLLVSIVLGAMISEGRTTANELHAHETLQGHPGTVVALELIQKQIDDFRKDFSVRMDRFDSKLERARP